MKAYNEEKNHYDFAVRGGRVMVDGQLTAMDIACEGGKIVMLQLPGRELKAEKTFDARGKLILPGSVDPHVHVRAPGMEQREDFLSGTRAAANGGVTTMIEHPIANPPQYCLEILERRIASAQENAVVDFAFYGAAGSDFPDKVEELAESGLIVSFKTFLHEAPEGRDSEFIGLTMKDDSAQYEGMKSIGRVGKICGVHAENNDIIKNRISQMRGEGRVHGRDHALSRPPITEYETVAKLLLIAKETGARIEFCHISTPEAMEMIKQAKCGGLDVYLETCPQYLLLDETLLDQYGPFAKCNPPLRSKESVEALWSYVNDGSVDFIGSDHAPYTYEEKLKGNDDIFSAPSGIPCIEMRVPLILDAVNRGKLPLSRAVELLCINPAKVFGLYPRKGAVQIGADADFTIVDMNETWTVRVEDMYTKCRKSALIFDGMRLTGRVKATIVRGKVIMENGVVSEADKGYGQLIRPFVR